MRVDLFFFREGWKDWMTGADAVNLFHTWVEDFQYTLDNLEIRCCKPDGRNANVAAGVWNEPRKPYMFEVKFFYTVGLLGHNSGNWLFIYTAPFDCSNVF